MNLQLFIENFPWRRFGTPYETNANKVKQSVLKIIDGTATEKDYYNLINSLESQTWLVKLSPWGLKLYFALLTENKADKALLLNDMHTLFEAANYSSQSPQSKEFKATKGKTAKYEAFKEKLFDPDFDGVMDNDFLKIVKSLDRYYYHTAVLELFKTNISFLENLAASEDKTVAEKAASLIEAIKNPKTYPSN